MPPREDQGCILYDRATTFAIAVIASKKLRDRRDIHRTNIFLSDGCRNDHYDCECMWQ